MKKRNKLIFGIGVPALIIIIAAVSLFSSRSTGPKYTTQAAAMGNIVQTVEATGSVASAQELALSFKASGRIDQIKVKVGDKVTAGQLLAVIRDRNASAQVERARASVSSAQAQLDKLLAGAKTEEILVNQQKVAQAQADLDAAKVDLTNTQSKMASTRQGYFDTASQEINNALFTAGYALDTVYDGVADNEAINNLFSTYSDDLNTARINYVQAGGQLNDLQLSKNKLSASSTAEEVVAVLKQVRALLDSTLSALDSGYKGLSGAVVNNIYTASRIETLKTSFNSRAASVAADKTSTQTSISNLTTGLDTIQNTLNQAETAVTNATNALALAEAQMNLLTSKPKDYEIKQQQAVLMQAQADLNSALGALSDTVITSPIDAVVTAVDLKIGETATPSQSVIKIIGQNELQIDLDIPESDITKVVIDTPVTITLDAFGPDKIFDGHVKFIEPSQRIIQDVVYYRVTVLFDVEPAEVKSGMTANVTMITAKRENVLTIPLRAVVISAVDGSKTVRVLNSNNIETRTVTTGVRGDDGSVEVLSGLNAGDLVVTGESSS